MEEVQRQLKPIGKVLVFAERGLARDLQWTLETGNIEPLLKQQ